MNTKLTLSVLLAIVVIGVGGYWYWVQTAANVPQKISSFPKEVRNSRYVYGYYSVTEDLHANELTFKNLKTGETKILNNRAVDLLVGDGFSVYITESKNEPTDQKGNQIAVFELRKYDFNTGKEELLIPHIANNDNPNGPRLDISVSRVLVSGYGNNVTLYDLDTNAVESTKLTVGEKTRNPNQAESYLNITPGLYDVVPNHTFFIDNSIVFEADVFGSDNALFSYDTINKTYKKIYSTDPSVHFAEMYSSGGYVYWSEVKNSFAVYKFYKMKVI